MSINHLIIVTAEPKSVFLETLFKYFKSKKNKLKKKTITLIGSKSFIEREAKKNKFKILLNEVSDINDSIKDKFNLIDIPYKLNLKRDDFSSYISDSFQKSLSILKTNKEAVLLNGPINKQFFLKKKYFGMTEYLAKKTGAKNPIMLIYNKKFSVSPITTHVPIKHVAKSITKIKIINNIKSIINFYDKNFGIKPKIAILGLNPHCETIESIGEEKKNYNPSNKKIRKGKNFC